LSGATGRTHGAVTRFPFAIQGTFRRPMFFVPDELGHSVRTLLLQIAVHRRMPRLHVQMECFVRRDVSSIDCLTDAVVTFASAASSAARFAAACAASNCAINFFNRTSASSSSAICDEYERLS
jgi:hypothetical protein